MFATVPYRARSANSIASRSLGKPAAAYPGRVATDSDLMIAVDRQQTRLAAPLDASATSMTVENPAILSAYNLLTIDSEIVKTTGPAVGNAIPIARGFDGTTPAVHLASTIVSGFVDAWHHNALVAEVEAIENALGANLSKIPSSPLFQSESYDFTPIPGAVGLNVGSNVITLSPLPEGIAIGNKLYVSGGSGTPEAVPLTGLTGNQAIITCANAHPLPWTISSASEGIQEAIVAAQAAGGGTVILPPGTRTAHGTVNVTGNGVHIMGASAGGFTSSTIERTENYGDTIAVTGNDFALSGVYLSHVINYNPSPFPGTISNKPTTGAHLRLQNVNTAAIRDCRFQDMPYNTQIFGGAEIAIQTCQFVGLWEPASPTVQVTHASVQVNYSSSPANIATYIKLLANEFYGRLSVAAGQHNSGPKYMVQVNGVEDMEIDGGAMGGASIANLAFFPSSASGPIMGMIRVRGVKFDSARDADLLISGDGAFSVTDMVIANNVFNGEGQSNHAISVTNPGGSPSALAVAIIGNDFLAYLSTPIHLLDGVGFLITGNQIRHYNTLNGFSTPAGSSGIYAGGRFNRALIENNAIGGGQAYSVFGTGGNFCNYGLSIEAPATLQSMVRYRNNTPFFYADVGNYTTTNFDNRFQAFPDRWMTLTTGVGAGSLLMNFTDQVSAVNIPAEFNATSYTFRLGPTSVRELNYIAAETGAANAIAGTLVNIALTPGLRVTVKLAHTLQAGANTFAYNGGAAVAIKSSRNAASNITTAYAATGLVTLQYDGAQWLDVSQ